jgi:hypothetical protein
MAADGRVDGPRTLDDAPHQRLIVPPHAARLQLPDQIGLRLERLGDDHQATGILVEPMHDARPRHLVELRRECSSALSRVPLQLPLPGCTTRPAGLSRTIRQSSSYTTCRGISSGADASARSSGASATSMVSPAQSLLPRLRAPPCRRRSPGPRVSTPAGGCANAAPAARKNLVQPLTAAIGGYVQGNSGVCAIIGRPAVAGAPAAAFFFCGFSSCVV